MYPDLMHIETAFGLIKISSYSFFLWIAILVVTVSFYRRCRAHVLSRRKSFIISSGMIFAALVGAKLLMLTIPFVIYGVARYLYVIYEKREGESPERVLLNDQPLLASTLLWGIIVITIMS